MALDGIVMANLTFELATAFVGGKIAKIAQPEADELLLTIKNNGATRRLLISAGASLPLLYITDENKPAPMTAPNFCMLLRKHIGNGRIVSITQPGLERILNITVEHLNELGDLCRKKLIIELMGKHSNIIFCHENDVIIDSIKHIPASVSSVREVLPGRPYFIPDTMQKLDPLSFTQDDFLTQVISKPLPCAKALYSGITGISPLVAEEICFLSSVDSGRIANQLSKTEADLLYQTICNMIKAIQAHNFTPSIYYDDNDIPAEFASVSLHSCSDYECEEFETISEVLETFYASRDKATRIRQKSFDLRRIVQTALDRSRKKYDLQIRQLKDTEKRDKFRIYGELLNTYGYELIGGEKQLTALNYYTNEEVTIPLDETLSARENANRYFDKYNKLKRTYEALTSLIEETKTEVEHLESISTALDIALYEEDLTQIKEELREYGYVKKRGPKDKKAKITSRPMHYLSSDGFHLYVGKNNYQNEELTFKFAIGNDWWFHAKGIPGSHVIVKTEGKELPDRTYEEAARLAAYYSKGRENDKVEIDYIEKKHVKKAPGGKPGFVIYHTNYSMLVSPDIRDLSEITAK